MTDRSYQVLARKWRPQKFDQVVGQAAIVRTLRNALAHERIAHAYCFSGIRGVGKTTIARLLAKGLNCRSTEAPTAEPCGTCEACVEIEESRNLDVIELDAASQTGVDSIRQLNEVARYTPSRDRNRIFIIDEAHMLSAPAFNALLKTLEEPPPHVVFMLATTEPHKILQTVLSRCQHYSLGRISQTEITARLGEIIEAEGVRVSEDGLAMVAIAADGSLRDAQSLLDKLIAFGGDEVDDETVADLLGMVDRELLFTAADLVVAQDLAGVLGLVNEMVEQGVDLHQFTLDFLGHLRALLVVATVDNGGEILHLPEADIARLQEQAQKFEVEDLDRSFALVSASEYRIKQSEMPRYHLEMVLSRLARMPKLEPIENLIRDLRSGSGGASGSQGGATGGPTRSGRSGSSAARKASAAPPRRPAPTPQPARPPAAPTQPASAPSPASPAPVQSSTAAAQGPAAAPAEGPPAAVAAAPASTPAAEELPPIGEPPPPFDEATVPFDEAPVPFDEQPAPPPAPVAAPRPAATRGADVRSIFERLRADKPLVSKVVERATSAEFGDDTLTLDFPENGGLYRARMRDQATIAAIEEAGAAALGRPIGVVATFGGEAVAPDAAPPAAAAPSGSRPSGLEDQQRRELWQRAEKEPLVQSFVDALQGSLTDVEET